VKENPNPHSCQSNMCIIGQKQNLAKLFDKKNQNPKNPKTLKQNPQDLRLGTPN